jgi:hypothetical protein
VILLILSYHNQKSIPDFVAVQAVRDGNRLALVPGDLWPGSRRVIGPLSPPLVGVVNDADFNDTASPQN